MEINTILFSYILAFVLELFSVYYIYRIDGISISFFINFIIYYNLSIKNKFIDNMGLVFIIFILNNFYELF
jgi:hypothetical protein